jgi:hypothetical protein
VRNSSGVVVGSNTEKKKRNDMMGTNLFNRTNLYMNEIKRKKLQRWWNDCGENKEVYKMVKIMLQENPKGKTLLGRPRLRQEN